MDFFLLLLANNLQNIFDDCSGYADDYKLIFTNQKQINDGVSNAENWCFENGIKLNAKKCGLMVLKGNMNAEIQNVEIREQNIQRILGLYVTKERKWDDNSIVRFGKALEALNLLKRKISCIWSVEKKLHSFAGYVIPILTFVSPAAYLNTICWRKIESPENCHCMVLWISRTIQGAIPKV